MEMLTKERAKQLAKAAVEAWPDRRNPSTGDGSCLYTSYDGKTHCIVGQVLADAGLPVPGPDVIVGFDSVGATYVEHVDLAARAWLERIQPFFDQAEPWTLGEPIQWADAWARVIDKGLS